MTDFYFQDYSEWRAAFGQRCNIQLTPEYAKIRLEALNDRSVPSTAEFVQKYGEEYLQQVIQWFERVERGA